MWEVAQTAGFDHIVEHLDVGKVFLAIEGWTSKSFTTQQYLILLEVGLLQDNLCTVRESQLGVAELVVLGLFLDATLLRHGGHQWLVLYIVNVGLDLGRTCIGNSLLHALLCRICWTLLLCVHTEYHQVTVVGQDQLLHQGVDGLQRQHWNNLLHGGIGVVNAWHWSIVQEVLNTLIYKLRIVTLVFVWVLFLKLTGVVLLETVVLCSCKAELCSTACFGEGSSNSCFNLAVLRT